MSVQWFCRIAGKTYGPLSAQQMKKAATAGKLFKSDAVKKGVEGKWIQAHSVEGLFAESVTTNPGFHKSKQACKNQADSQDDIASDVVPATTLPAPDLTMAIKEASSPTNGTFDWYCQLNGRQIGPMRGEQLVDMARQRRLHLDTLIRHGDETGWNPASRYEELVSARLNAKGSLKPIAATPKESHVERYMFGFLGFLGFSICATLAVAWFFYAGGTLIGTIGAVILISVGAGIARACGFRLR